MAFTTSMQEPLSSVPGGWCLWDGLLHRRMTVVCEVFFPGWWGFEECEAELARRHAGLNPAEWVPLGGCLYGKPGWGMDLREYGYGFYFRCLGTSGGRMERAYRALNPAFRMC